MKRLTTMAAGLAVAISSFSAMTAVGATIDFTTDDGGNPLGNGQKIDVGQEFGNLFDISSAGPNLGAAIFNSNNPGPNDGGADPDLLVNLGNILILQSNNFPALTGDFFDTPNDDAGGGTLFFDFFAPTEMLSIDLIDINGNGPVSVILRHGAESRTYDVPMFWTFDINVGGPNGFDTLDLTTLADQLGEGGGTATAAQTGGFDPTLVTRLEVIQTGSGGVDNLSFVPEPSSILLLAFGASFLLRRRR